MQSNEYYSLIERIPYPLGNELPTFNTSGKLVIALFEFRPMKEMLWVLNAILHIYKPCEIGLAIVHGENNKDFVHQHFSNWKNILLINTQDHNHDSHSYSNRLVTPELWENFSNWSHVLVYQCDALLLRPIDDIYFKYDYIGGAWPNNDLPGNGGFSLRNVQSMIRVCEPFRNMQISDFKCPHVHEDGFFCRHDGFIYPSDNERNIHEQFAIESIYNENPVGVHKFYEWVNRDTFDKIMNNIKSRFTFHLRHAYILCEHENTPRCIDSRKVLESIGFRVHCIPYIRHEDKIYSNKISMQHIYQMVIDSGEEWSYIFEDDINKIYDVKLVEIMEYESISDDLFYLGACFPENVINDYESGSYNSGKKIGDYDVRYVSDNCFGLHGVAFSKEGMKKFLEYSNTSFDSVMDVTLKKFTSKHPANIVRFDLCSPHMSSHRGVIYQDRDKYPTTI